jgi:hypothetical protein
VTSVEYFAASEATVLRRGCEVLQLQPGTRLNQQQGSAASFSGKEHKNASALKSLEKSSSALGVPFSNDPIVQLAASIVDSSHSLTSTISTTSTTSTTSAAMGALQQELSKLQAHRAIELERMKAAMQHPPANLLMRERNLPESQPSEKGVLELSLRNRCGSAGDIQIHTHTILILVAHA